ncbi:MauE/DoxX family redox-associated membrane protein [Fulvivirga sedimenti]|uniref:Methylamine utilisation protein MauE domain-containing protein n=1 Tax=Fulvivirga sedimenti TaxID=2879465 RepID=A0A9X1HNB1_9BACT|nr:MauE/DoxX family redox-associated membrane protein [Fulvivirga sedimenti]MCA6074155.1 hypothetical protein [Fulvivirga sedimenti]
MKRIRFDEIAALILLVVFTYSAGLKLFDIQDFQVKLLRVNYLPVSLIIPVSVAIPFMELTSVVLYLDERSRRLAAMLMYPLMVIFTGHLLILHKLSPGTPCSCGGIFESLSFKSHLLINFILILCAAVVLARKVARN